MSNYKTKARNKKTGEVVEVSALDDYFGKHNYGYKVGDRVYDQYDFDEVFEIFEIIS